MTDQTADAQGENQENAIVTYFKGFKVLKQTKKEYWWLQVVNMLDCIAYFAMFNIATVTLSKDFGYTDIGAGWVYAWFSGTTTIFLFFSGVMTDWLGIKRALYIAMFGLLLTRVGIVAVQYMDEPVRMSEETQLAELYDGAGIPIVEGQPDLAITARDQTAFVVDLSGAVTVGDVLNRINGATGNDGLIEAAIAPGWINLRLTDNSDVPEVEDLAKEKRLEMASAAVRRMSQEQVGDIRKKLEPKPPEPEEAAGGEGTAPPEEEEEDEDAEPPRATPEEIAEVEQLLTRAENEDKIDEVIEAGWLLTVKPTAANPDAAKKLQLLTWGTDSTVFNGKRLTGDLNGIAIADINQGEGLMGGDTLEVVDRMGKEMKVAGLDQVKTPTELLELLKKEAKAQPANISFSLNTPGNGFVISDLNKAPDGGKLREGHLIVRGNAAEALQLAADLDDEKEDKVAGSSLVDNPLRSWLTWGLLVLMAPFMAMLITIFQAGNRRFTTNKSRGAGFNLWYLAMNVGAMGGGLLIDIIYKQMGIPHFHVFTFGIITGVLCLLVIFFFMKNCEQMRLEGEDEEAEEEKAEDEPEEKTLGPVAIAKAVLSTPIFWRFTVLITLLLGVRAVFLYIGLLFPKYWYRVIGEDAAVGTMQAFNPFLVIVGLMLVIPALQKFNVYKMLVFGALITSISMFIPAIPQMFGTDIVTWTYVTTGVFLLILTIGELIWSPRLSEYTAAIAPPGQEGTYLGLSMVPYFLAKLVISAYSGWMLTRWCPEYPPGEPNLGERIATGEIGFLDSPNMMWIVLGAAALIGTTFAILGKGWFTKGAHFDKN